MMINTGKNKFPFTEAQWQELEHQALIFKYMVSGIPLPSDLLFTIRRSRSYFDPSLPSNLFSPNVEWNCFKMGLGKKIDPEPGRCRRTDGKKWRCSKEAYVDSKYCERHMHRGKNRSRKPVEVFKTTGNRSKKYFSSTHSPLSTSLSSDHNPFHYHHSSSSSKATTGFGLSPDQDSNTTLLLDSGYYSHTYTDYSGSRSSSFYKVKEEVNHKQSFFSNQASGTRVRSGVSVSSSTDDSWQFSPLNMSCSSSLSQRNNDNSNYLQLQSFNNITHKEHSQDQNQQQYINNDIRVIERNEETQKTIHHFFDEWPIRKEKDSWLDLDDNGSVSTTQLSISVPSYDQFV